MSTDLRSPGADSKLRLPRYERISPPLKITIGTPKLRCLTAIAKYHYLTAEQITRLHYGKSLTYVQKHLAELYHAAYVQRVFRPTFAPHGAPRAFYCLDRKALAYLRRAGLLPEGRIKPSEAQREWWFLLHTEAANDLLILAELLTKEDPRISITRSKTERELKVDPIYVNTGGSTEKLVPDGWVEFKSAKTASIAFELDRSTVRRRDWHKKIQAYSQAIKGSYQEAFGTEYLTIAVVTPTHRRTQELLAWTEAQLRGLGDTTLASILLFASFNPAKSDPREALYAPIWQMPLSPTRYALIEPSVFT